MNIRVLMTGGGWAKAKRGLGKQAAVKLKAATDIALQAGSAYLLDVIKRNIITKGEMMRQPFEPLSPMTIAKKKNPSNKNKILIDTGAMIRSLSAQKMKAGEYMIGFFGTEGAKKAAFHEVGGITTIEGRSVFVPARPFLGPVIESKSVEQNLTNLFQSAIHNVLISM